LAGIAGGCNAIEPLSTGGDSVIRIGENVIEQVAFAQATNLIETVTESVTVQVTWG